MMSLAEQRRRDRRNFVHRMLCDKGSQTTFQFKNQIQEALWKEELTGQISDGMWENTPNTGWQFWCSLKTTIGEDTKIIGDVHPTSIKYAFQFSSLIQYTGEDMINVGKRFDREYNENKLRADLTEIKKAMKAFRGE